MIQAAISTEIIISAMAFIIIPSILIILMPIIDAVLTPEVIAEINTAIDQVEYFIGSQNTNVLFAMIWIILLIIPARRLLKFFKH